MLDKVMRRGLMTTVAIIFMLNPVHAADPADVTDGKPTAIRDAAASAAADPPAAPESAPAGHAHGGQHGMCASHAADSPSGGKACPMMQQGKACPMMQEQAGGKGCPMMQGEGDGKGCPKMRGKHAGEQGKQCPMMRHGPANAAADAADAAVHDHAADADKD